MQHDLSGVVQEFMAGKIPDRAELLREIGAAINTSRPFKYFLVQVAHECVVQNADPVHTARIGVLYGAVLGILMERERLRRSVQ